MKETSKPTSSSTSKKRVFIAIPTSQTLKRKVSKWQKSHKKLNVRFLKPKNLHFTIIPPWYTDDIEAEIKKLQKIAGKFSSDSLTLTKITLGPTLKSPRLIWAEGQTPPLLPKLKKALEKIFKTKPDNRRYLLHLTLARFKTPPKFPEEKINWSQRITKVVLMQSHLTPKHAEYKILAEIPLI